jgi:hypothetical protein
MDSLLSPPLNIQLLKTSPAKSYEEVQKSLLTCLVSHHNSRILTLWETRVWWQTIPLPETWPERPWFAALRDWWKYDPNQESFIQNQGRSLFSPG